MALQPDYDLVVQFGCDVVRDVRKRVINASVLTNLAVTSPISRVIAQVVPPFQMKAHWAEPQLDISDDLVSLSAEVHGGVRHVIRGINLTMGGKVGADCRAMLTVTGDGLPVATLSPPSPLDLDLADLELSYEGDDEPLSWADRAVEEALLRPTLCGLLMAPLAGLPLNYVPASLRLYPTGADPLADWGCLSIRTPVH